MPQTEVVAGAVQRGGARRRKAGDHRDSRRRTAVPRKSSSDNRCSASSFSHLASRDQTGATSGNNPKDENEKEHESIGSAKNSFSDAVKECQNRRIRSEARPPPSRKNCRRRSSSLDNLIASPSCTSVATSVADMTLLSPRLLTAESTTMRRGSTTSTKSGAIHSPVTPNYRHNAAAAASCPMYQKGWSSERVPLQANSSRRYLPFGNGRALPSKWEDAEKWIFSPVSADGSARPATTVPPHHRRPKSKSGPLGAPTGFGTIGVVGASSSSAASPLVPCFDSGRVNFTAGSPFLAGVLVANRGNCSGHGSRGRRSSHGGGDTIDGDDGTQSYSTSTEQYIVRSASVHGWSDMLLESSSSLPSSQGTVQGEKGGTMEVTSGASPVLRKDMATQMSPDRSCPVSPKERPSFSASPRSAHPVVELEQNFCRLEVRDVPVDDRVTMTRWSKKHVPRGLERRSTNLLQWTKKSMEATSCAWDVETAKCISSKKREEARITAWENLQRAKAESEIQKLEMKLEKKRSSSMDKILNKLRSAQKKAEEMRNAVNASENHQSASCNRTVSFIHKPRRISSFGGCFTCHGFKLNI